MMIFSFGKGDSEKGEVPSRSMALGTSMNAYLSDCDWGPDEGELGDGDDCCCCDGGGGEDKIEPEEWGWDG